MSHFVQQTLAGFCKQSMRASRSLPEREEEETEGKSSCAEPTQIENQSLRANTCWFVTHSQLLCPYIRSREKLCQSLHSRLLLFLQHILLFSHFYYLWLVRTILSFFSRLRWRVKLSSSLLKPAFHYTSEQTREAENTHLIWLLYINLDHCLILMHTRVLHPVSQI